jgi:hypothetical protein
MKNIAKKRMSGIHQRGGEFQKDLKEGAPRRNTKQSVGFKDETHHESNFGLNQGEEQQEGASFSSNH